MDRSQDESSLNNAPNEDNDGQQPRSNMTDNEDVPMANVGGSPEVNGPRQSSFDDLEEAVQGALYYQRASAIMGSGPPAPGQNEEGKNEQNGTCRLCGECIDEFQAYLNCGHVCKYTSPILR